LTYLAGVPLETASAFTKVANPATAKKSCAGSKSGFLTTIGKMEMVWSCDKKTVLTAFYGFAMNVHCRKALAAIKRRFSFLPRR